MSYDWQEYLTLAEVLQTRATELGSEVACYRSAASRAYYAAYHRALDLTGPTHYAPSKKRNVSVHAEFREHLFKAAATHSEPQQTQLRRIANILKRLWGHRKSADYDSELDNSPEDLAAFALLDAADIMMYVEGFLDV